MIIQCFPFCSIFYEKIENVMPGKKVGMKGMSGSCYRKAEDSIRKGHIVEFSVCYKNIFKLANHCK